MTLSAAYLAAVLAISALAAPIPLGRYQLLQAGGLGFRHCDYQAYATPVENGNDDFNFDAIPALSGDANAVSFMSVNYPSMALTIIPNAGFAETGRLGIAEGADPFNASWTVVPGLSNPAMYSIQSQSKSPAFAGKYITKFSQLSGSCAGNYGTPSGDVYLSDGSSAAAATWTLGFTPPPPPPSVSLDWSNVTHTVNKLYNGCHHDPGTTTMYTRSVCLSARFLVSHASEYAHECDFRTHTTFLQYI